MTRHGPVAQLGGRYNRTLDSVISTRSLNITNALNMGIGKNYEQEKMFILSQHFRPVSEIRATIGRQFEVPSLLHSSDIFIIAIYQNLLKITQDFILNVHGHSEIFHCYI